MVLRLQTAAMIYLMLQAVLFGGFTIALLALPVSGDALALLPLVVAGSSAASAPAAWWLAPRLQPRA